MAKKDGKKKKSSQRAGQGGKTLDAPHWSTRVSTGACRLPVIDEHFVGPITTTFCQILHNPKTRHT